MAGESAPALSCCYRRSLSPQSSSVFHSLIVMPSCCMERAPPSVTYCVLYFKRHFILMKLHFHGLLLFWNYFPFSLPEFHNFLQSNRRIILQIYSDIRDGFCPN